MAHDATRSSWATTLPWVFVGMLAGISFFAQPVKFLTPGLTPAQLVSVGATIFHASHGMQWLALALMAMVVVPKKEARRAAGACLLVGVACLGLQQMALMPALDLRLAQLRDGVTPAPSPHHAVYVVLELLKLAALIALARLRATTRKQGDFS